MKISNHNVRWLVFALTIAAVLLSNVIVIGFAQDKLPPRDGHINDFASTVDPATKQRLETVLENLKQRTDIDLVIAIVKTVGAQDLYDYSLKAAGEWNIGARTSPRKSLLLMIAADNARFFSQFSRGVQSDLPDGLIGEMGRRMRPRLEAKDYNGGLLVGVQTFTNGIGEQHNFTFAQLDPQGGENLLAQSRARTVTSPAPGDSVIPQGTNAPEIVPTPTPVETPSPQATETPTLEVSPTAMPTATIAETPMPAPSPSPVALASPEPSETPAMTSPSASPLPVERASPNAEVARNNSSKLSRPAVIRANPEDEKEEVELTLTKPLDERMRLLKAFIAAHPTSVAVPRANELLVAAHAGLGDQKLQARDVTGGLEQFRLAISEAPVEMTDGLFTEVLARIPMNLFLRAQRGAAIEAAHQVEALAKLNPKRLLPLAEFYLAIEDAGEAQRLGELLVQTAPDLAAAHQALGAARHIALRLDDAETEYARALALNPKSTSAKLALADLKRANDKTEAALVLYRELAETDPKNKSARAGIVLSLLELGRRDEAEQELNRVLSDPGEANNLPVLVGAAYWFLAHGAPPRALELAQKAVSIEPRYSWADIALARALVAANRPLEAERALRFARQYGRFATLDYELATVLAAIGLYDEALETLSQSFSLKDGQLETKLARRVTAHAPANGMAAQDPCGVQRLAGPERAHAPRRLGPEVAGPVRHDDDVGAEDGVRGKEPGPGRD